MDVLRYDKEYEMEKKFMDIQKELKKSKIFWKSLELTSWLLEKECNAGGNRVKLFF